MSSAVTRHSGRVAGTKRLSAEQAEVVDLVESSPLVISAWDDDFNCVGVSEPAMRSLHHGRTREQVIGQSIYSFRDPKARSEMEGKLAALKRDGHFAGRTKVLGGDGIARGIAFLGSVDVAPGIHVLLTLSLGGQHAASGRVNRVPDQATVLLATPDALAAPFLASGLGAFPEINLVAECHDWARLHAAALGHRPQVTIIATSPFAKPSLGSADSGLLDVAKDLLEFMLENAIDSKVLVFDHLERTDVAVKLLALGVAGVVGPTVQASTIGTAVQAVANGGEFVDASLARAIARLGTQDDELLTRREIEVARLVALGYTNQEIADEIFLSIRTVEAHRSNIKAKLEAKSRREVVAWAIERRLIP